MKKTAIIFCILLGMPLLANASVSIEINSPGVSIQLGDRNERGDYWDGYDWRAPQWWHTHKNHHIGERGPRGDYWNGNGWQPRPPASHGASHHPDRRNPQSIAHNHHDERVQNKRGGDPYQNEQSRDRLSSQGHR